MKKHVIFLGAGASCTAGFPTNDKLARIIIEDLPTNDFLGVYSEIFKTQSGIPRTFQQCSDVLRLSGYLSVDAFCKNNSAKGPLGVETEMMKRVLRFALITKTNEFWKTCDYTYFVSMMFLNDTHHLRKNVTIINLNYDGLLGKLLTDAVRSRNKEHGILLPDERLAAICGGYFPSTSGEAIEALYSLDDFAHIMLHGTIAVSRDCLAFKDYLHEIYSGSPHDKTRLNWSRPFLAEHFSDTPAIVFPWEADHWNELLKNRMLVHIQNAIAGADVLHFIGISGHPILEGSFRQFLIHSQADHLVQKEWHVSTVIEDKRSVLRDILKRLEGNGIFSNDLLYRITSGGKFTQSNSFAEWIHRWGQRIDE